jgi:hypothetical protein
MKSQSILVVILGLLLAPISSALAQGYTSQPRGAMSTMHGPVIGERPARRSLLDAMSTWSLPQRQSKNFNWRNTEWSDTAQTSGSTGSGFKLPWASDTPEPLKPTGTRRVYQGSRPPELQAQSQPKRGWLASLFAPAEEPKRPQTVNEFLSLPKPE